MPSVPSPFPPALRVAEEVPARAFEGRSVATAFDDLQDLLRPKDAEDGDDDDGDDHRDDDEEEGVQVFVDELAGWIVELECRVIDRTWNEYLWNLWLMPRHHDPKATVHCTT